jgi:hypothetical protein
MKIKEDIRRHIVQAHGGKEIERRDDKKIKE